MNAKIGQFRFLSVAICLAISIVTGCDTGITALPPGVNAGADGLSAAQKLRAEQYTSIFENDTIVLDYAYVVALDDGRGYTAGRAGFTTATCDALEVINRYTTLKPGNGLAGYLPRLIELCDTNSDSLVGLEGFPEAWPQAAEDVDFIAVQDDVVDDFYYRPALARAASAGLKSPLGVAAFYDAIIQHGDGDDHDALQSMIDRAVANAGGSPATGVDETIFLRAFLTVRRATLSNAFDPATREAWAESVDRVDSMVTILDDGNLMLEGPIHVATPNHDATIP